MTAAGKTQQNIRSTDRAGTLTLSVGVLLLAAGLGFLIGMTAQTTSVSLSVLKSTVIGVAGVMSFALPVMLIWLAVVLCISSRRAVSFRAVLLAWAFTICLLAFLTIITRVQGFGTLMDYVLNINVNFRRSASPGSMGAYIACAFSHYGGRISPLPGGGALGMLVAFPLWRMLGVAGSVTVLAITMAALFFLIIRVNPILLVQKMSDKSKAQPKTELADQAASPKTAQTMPADRPVPQEPVIAAVTQQISLEPPRPIATGENYVNRKPMEEAGFMPARHNFEDIYQQTGELTQPVAPIVEMEPEPQWTRQPPVSLPAVPHTDTPDVVYEDIVTATQAQREPIVSEPPPKQRISAEAKIEKIEEVGIKPAVSLTGKKIQVAPVPAALNPGSLDGTSHSVPKHKQLEMPRDDYEKPPLRMLSEPPMDEQVDHSEEDFARAEKLLQTLSSFSIQADVQQIVHGPAITRFAIRLGEGVNVNRLRNVMDNLSVELLAKSPVRAEIPIPGTPLIGIEVSNEKTSTVFLKEVLTSPKLTENKSPTTVALGKDITGAPVLCDLMDMPHLLIAGATGSGKSVCINAIITSLLYRASPQEVRLILVDPKFVELQPYNGCPHLLLPVITEDKKAVAALEWLCDEMDERYQKMQARSVRNIDAYNRRIGPDEDKLPKIVMIIDEMADLIATSGKSVEEHIKRITAKARAAGICLILATQRPSVNVITGVIKANIPSRIAFQVSSLVDSRTILDTIGAEKLLGYGDMLYMPRSYPAPARVQGCFISDKDVENITEFVKSRNQPNYNMDIMEHIAAAEQNEERFSPDSPDALETFDELLPEAIEMAVEAGQTSISMLQRVLRVGYGRAGRLIDEMDRRGIISGNEGTKPRKTLMTREEHNRLMEMGDPKVL